MKLIQAIRNLLRRNADPVACACAIFTKQIAALEAYIDTQQRQVEAKAIEIAKANEAIETSLNEVHRASNIKRNIEAIVDVNA